MQHAINTAEARRDIIVIGASAGGIAAVIELLSLLPAGLPASLCVVIHRGSHALTNWSHMLGGHAKLHVIEPTDGVSLEYACVYVAPSDRHMTLRNNKLYLDGGPRQHYTRPAVDPLFSSAAEEYGPRVLGVLLTGGGFDGTQGLVDIAAAGGICLVQSPTEAEHPAMPKHAIEHDHVSAALYIREIAAAIPQLAEGRPYVTARAGRALPLP
jgi:two-component system chemotaxis response regulator CheB